MGCSTEVNAAFVERGQRAGGDGGYNNQVAARYAANVRFAEFDWPLPRVGEDRFGST